MSAQKKEGFISMATDLSTPDLLKLAISIRDTYVHQVAQTREKLDPARLRKLDAAIKDLQAELN